MEISLELVLEMILTQFPWFSPAGNSRGAILNAVKLAYNPSKLRDVLYSNRINPVIFQPGDGIILLVIRLDLENHPHLIE